MEILKMLLIEGLAALCLLASAVLMVRSINFAVDQDFRFAVVNLALATLFGILTLRFRKIPY